MTAETETKMDRAMGSATPTHGWTPEPERPPTREHPRGVEPIRTLFEAAPDSIVTRDLPGSSELVRLYDGPLAIPLVAGRPFVMANFATSLDGVVAMDRDGRTSGGDVSGFSPTDRSVMGLLRAMADTIVVGAGTVRGSGGRGWTADGVDPARAGAHAELRRSLGLAPEPTVVILTESGALDPGHPAFARSGAPLIVAGPATAMAHLRAAGLPSRVAVRPVASDSADAADELAALLVEVGGGVTLFESGPHLFGAFLVASLIDELFLTLSPQLVGRTDSEPRLELVEDAVLWPDRAPWGELRSVRQAGSHLFLRYRLRSLAVAGAARDTG